MNNYFHNGDDEEDEMMLKSSMDREDTYDPNEYDEHGDEAPLEDDEDQYSDEEIPSATGGNKFNFFIQGGKLPIREAPPTTSNSLVNDKNNQRKIKEDDDFEYNIDDESDDEIYPISSDEEESSSPLQQLKPSIQTVVRRKSPMKNPISEEKKSISSPPQTNNGRPSSSATTKIRATLTKTTAPQVLDDDSPDEFSIIPPKPKLALNKISKYTDDDVRSLTSSRSSSEISVGGEDKMKNQLDYLKQKQEQLFKLNQQLNVETKHVLKETDDIVKQQSKKVDSISSRTISRPTSSASTVRSNTPSNTHRSNVSTATTTTTRPSSVQPSARKKVIEKIEEATQFEDDDLDKAANEMGIEAAMKFYKARVKSLQKDIQEYSNQLKLKDDKIKELGIKYNATMIENKKVTKAQSQFHSRLDRQRKDFDALQLKFKKQTTLMNEMQKENEKLKQNLRMDGSGSNKEAETPSGNNNERIKDLKYTRALEEVEKLKSQLSEVQKQQREDSDKQRKDSENLRKDNKRLERQKQDIVLAFKKQMKLIDVLKRQIIHLEASKQLSFTEEEFTSLMNQ